MTRSWPNSSSQKVSCPAIGARPSPRLPTAPAPCSGAIRGRRAVWRPAAAEAARAVAEYLDQHLGTGEYPHIEALLGDGDRWTALARLAAAYPADERFERGLARLLDGVAQEVARHRRATRRATSSRKRP